MKLLNQLPSTEQSVAEIPTQAVKTPAGANKTALMSNANLTVDLPLILSQHGVAYAVMSDRGCPYALKIGSKQLNYVIRSFAHDKGRFFRNSEVNEINELLLSQAESSSVRKDVWSRVAPIDGGIELDVCDDANTRIRVTAGEVEVLTDRSDTLFYKNPMSQPLVMPAKEGNLDLLKNYTPNGQVFGFPYVGNIVKRRKITALDAHDYLGTERTTTGRTL